MGWEKEKRGRGGQGWRRPQSRGGRKRTDRRQKKFLAVFGQTEREKKEEEEGGKITDAQKGKTKKEKPKELGCNQSQVRGKNSFSPVLICLAGSVVQCAQYL